MRSGTGSTVALLLCLGCTSGLPVPVPPLLQPTQRQVEEPEPDEEAVVRSRAVTIDLNQFQTGPRRLRIPLFDEKTAYVAIDSHETLRIGGQQEGTVWHGRVENQPESIVTLSLVGDTLVGNLRMQDGRIYQIRPAGEGIHVLRQIDPSRLPPEAKPLAPIPRAREAETGLCATDPPTGINVLMLYTPKVWQRVRKDLSRLKNLVLTAADETNQSYNNSHIDQRLHVAHLAELAFTESGSTELDLKAFSANSEAQKLRDQHRADVSVLFLASAADFCGQAFIMENVSRTFAESAFAVVVLGCAPAPGYTFAHELGHLMSARHDWGQDSARDKPFPDNHGYIQKSPRPDTTPWRTIMAYPSDAERLPYWSNPNIKYPLGGAGGEYMGEASGSEPADNHRVLNKTALTVANFRCSSPTAPNVWMKDAWIDTGEEPDPRTAAEPLWASPYIWVRNARDTGLSHQHEHQNPRPGSTNWVYVKLHNGGAAMTSGRLELYWAHASTSLAWPARWNRLETVPVDNFAAQSTRVIETEWTTLPLQRHYSLVARWVSAADPMASPETIDLHANARKNNNIVWRTLNAVDLSKDLSSSASLVVRSFDGKNGPVSLAIRPSGSGPDASFIRHGRLTVHLDERLLKAWHRGGSQGTGFKIEGAGLVLTDPAGATLENIPVNPAPGQVELTFTKLPDTPRQRFRIDAMQFQSSKAGTLMEAVGGVRYEIGTEVSLP